MDDLQAVSAAIEARTVPVNVFFRNDDVGWANPRLDALCIRFDRYSLPLDLAVIPGALDSETTKEVVRVVRKYGSVLGFHQHGYAHTNHQSSGRKCEFGNARSSAEQIHDIAHGRRRLQDIFGELVDPIFTPPWNRCTEDTCDALRQLGFAALSRIQGSDYIDHFGLADISVSIDWQKKKSGQLLCGNVFAEYLADCLVRDDTVGVMLHHETLADSDLDRLCSFIERLQESKNVNFRSMLQICESIDTANRGECNAHA